MGSFAPGSPAESASLPPLPSGLSDNSGGKDAGGAGKSSPLAGLISGLTPVKMGVDRIVQECKSIVQGGNVPGAEQVCGQIIALATSLLPMAAQSMMQPGTNVPPQPGPVGPPVGAPPGPGPVGGMGQ
jgi:hypothetical protein